MALTHKSMRATNSENLPSDTDMDLENVAVAFANGAVAKKAIDDLLLKGFDRAQLGVIERTDESPGSVSDAYGESVVVNLCDDDQSATVLVSSLTGTVAGLAVGAVAAIGTAGAAVPTLIAAAAGAAGADGRCHPFHHIRN